MMMIYKSIWIQSTDTVISSVVRLKDVSYIHYPYKQIQLVLERFNKKKKKIHQQVSITESQLF